MSALAVSILIILAWIAVGFHLTHLITVAFIRKSTVQKRLTYGDYVQFSLAGPLTIILVFSYAVDYLDEKGWWNKEVE